VQVARQPTQIQEGLIYRVWLGTRHALGQYLKDAAAYVTIYVEWNVKQFSEV